MSQPTPRPPVLERWGRLIARRPWRVIAASLVLLIAAGVLAAGTLERLQLSRFESPSSASASAEERLVDEFGTGKHHALLLVTAIDGDVDSPEVRAAGEALERELAGNPVVEETASYWSTGDSPSMRSDDGRQAIVTMRLGGSVTEARGALAELSPEFTRDTAEVSVRVGGGDEIFRQAAQRAMADFTRAELIIFPLVFVLLLLTYRRISVAAVTLGMGLFAVVTTLGVLRLVAEVTEVSTFAANLTLVMGVGLGVDYSLFVITRFREELSGGAEVHDAVVTAVSRAGRTVGFSGVVVAASLACMVFFPFPFLQSFAYAGVAVVAMSVFAALVVLPAALALLGRRVSVRNGASAQGGRWWGRGVAAMMRHPLRWGVPALLVVLLLASPVLNLRLGLPDARVLPEGVTSRDVQDQIAANFQMEQMDAVHVIVDLPSGASEDDVSRYASDLSAAPGVGQVDSSVGRFADGAVVTPDVPGADQRYRAGDTVWMSVVPEGDALDDPEQFIGGLKEVGAPGEATIGGYPADLVDFRAALLSTVPLVLGLILLVTFALIFLMTGSVVLPLKAIVLNLLSLSVMFGVLVWGFQEGNLAGLLGFTPTGSLETTFPILMFCIAFGLSMDYEVFMMARIKEEHDRGASNADAVATGLQRSGPLVTTAALILAASFVAYAFSDVVYLKILAVGMAVVIVVDATLIRTVLVPVTMRLAGEWNWWAPAPLRRLHDRIGITH